jgi:hypothetical protein
VLTTNKSQAETDLVFKSIANTLQERGWANNLKGAAGTAATTTTAAAAAAVLN